MNQTSLVGRPLSNLVNVIVGMAEKRGIWSGPLMSSSPELARLWAAPTSSTGLGVNEETSLNYGPVWACVQRISADVASTSLILYKTRKDGGKERYEDAKLYELLHDAPNSEQSSMAFRQQLQMHVLLWGNGYAEIVRNGAGGVESLEPLTPNRVSVKRDERTEALFYEVSRLNGGIDRLPARDMFHLAGLSFDGIVGLSVIGHMRESIGLGLAGERFGGTFFGNGASFGGVISMKAPLTEAAEKNFREKMAAQHGGVERAHKFLLLGNEATYARLGIPPDDAQFLETRQFQRSEIAMWFGVPPHKIGDLERSTNNNIEHQDLEYYINTLRPWFKKWEQEIKMKLIPRLERKIQFAEHLQDSRYSADIQTRYAAYALGRNNGFLSANDIRQLENMNPLPGDQGDVYLVPQNMAPADRVDEIVDKQVAPDPKPVAPAPMPKPDAEDDNRMAEAIRTALAEVETRIAETTAKIVAAETETAQERDAKAALETTLADLQTQRASEQAEAATLRALLLETTERANRLELEQIALRAEHLDVQLHLTTAEQEIAEKAASLLTMQAQADALQAERDRLDAACVDATARAEQLQAEHARALAELQESVQAEQLDTARRVTELQTLATTAEAERDARIAELGTLEQLLAAAQTQVQAVTAELESLRHQAETATSVAEAAKVAAEAAASSLTAIQSAAEQRDADSATRLAAVTETAVATQATLEATKQAEAVRLQALLTAHRDLILDAMARLIWKETERARKNKHTPAKLKAWAEGFYLLHEETCVDALRPAIRTHLVFVGASQDVDAYTRGLVHPHLEMAKAQLEAVANGDADDFPVAIERLLTRWEQERPAAVADAVLQEEMTYVRSL